MAVALLSHSHSNPAEQQYQKTSFYPQPQQQQQAAAELDPFHTLVQEIRNYLGTSNGIDSEDIDVSYIQGLMKKYISNPQDWGRYAHADASKNYTRNCVENINGKANILILVWNPKKGSPVHDHANAHCIMKILQGTLKEEIFPIPSCSGATPLKAEKETIYSTDGVTYISDNIGLHRISNPDETELAVSLHLYTPPNAADFGYHIYDEKTGKSVFVNQAKANHILPSSTTSTAPLS